MTYKSQYRQTFLQIYSFHKNLMRLYDDFE